MRTQQFNNNNRRYRDTNTNTNKFVSNDVKKEKKYNYIENDFPDLVPSKKVFIENEQNVDTKYATIAATTNDIIIVSNDVTVPSGWIQYTKHKDKYGFIVKYGDKTRSQILQEQKDKLKSNPTYIHNHMIATLVDNWSRYKINYDNLHGEGSYDEIYYNEPIYSLEDFNSDVESDRETYDSYDEYASYDENHK